MRIIKKKLPIQSVQTIKCPDNCYFNKVEITKNIDDNFFDSINFQQNVFNYNNAIKLNKLYSILQYNFNDYEKFREPLEIDLDCEYIYITDNPNIKSNIWKVIVDPTLNKYTGFEKCYMVRYNLFKYCTTPVCIYMDSNIQILKSIRWLYDSFISSGADIGVNIHPFRNNIIDEYYAWIEKYQKYEPSHVENMKEEMQNVIKYMLDDFYNFDYKGLYQGTMRICKNTELNRNIDMAVLKATYKIAEKKFPRVTQTIFSYILNKYFNSIKVYPFLSDIFFSDSLYRYEHNSDMKSEKWTTNIDTYLFNRLIKL